MSVTRKKQFLSSPGSQGGVPGVQVRDPLGERKSPGRVPGLPPGSQESSETVFSCLGHISNGRYRLETTKSRRLVKLRRLVGEKAPRPRRTWFKVCMKITRSWSRAELLGVVSRGAGEVEATVADLSRALSTLCTYRFST